MAIDNFAEKFSEALYCYLWYLEDNVSETKVAEAFADVEEAGKAVPGIANVFDLVAAAAKSVFVLSVTHPRYQQTMDDHFKRKTITRLNVFNFIARYCFAYHAVKDDIFDVVLNTTTFVYSLAQFCAKRGHYEYVQFAAMCWNEVFEVDQKAHFRAGGGWDMFGKYVAARRYREGIRQKAGIIGLRAIVGFLEEIDYLGPRAGRVRDPDEQAAGFSFARNIPNLGRRVKDILHPFESADAKILQLLEKSKGKPSDQSGLPVGESSDNPVLNAPEIEQLGQACLKLQITAPDQGSIEPNSTNED